MTQKHDQHSHLFLVRFWSEEKQERQGWEWSGRVQHILTGEARHFHDWGTLVSLMMQMAQVDGANPESKQPVTNPQG
jgi:hypothetical protein